LFDREGRPKPAFEAVIKEGKGERGRGKGKAARWRANALLIFGVKATKGSDGRCDE